MKPRVSAWYFVALNALAWRTGVMHISTWDTEGWQTMIRYIEASHTQTCRCVGWQDATRRCVAWRGAAPAAPISRLAADTT